MGMKYRHMITNVYLFTNGMIAVFDQNFKQMPKFQGRNTPKLMKKIKDRHHRQKTDVVWHMRVDYDIAKKHM